MRPEFGLEETLNERHFPTNLILETPTKVKSVFSSHRCRSQASNPRRRAARLARDSSGPSRPPPLEGAMGPPSPLGSAVGLRAAKETSGPYCGKAPKTGTRTKGKAGTRESRRVTETSKGERPQDHKPYHWHKPSLPGDSPLPALLNQEVLSASNPSLSSAFSLQPWFPRRVSAGQAIYDDQ